MPSPELSGLFSPLGGAGAEDWVGSATLLDGLAVSVVLCCGCDWASDAVEPMDWVAEADVGEGGGGGGG